MEITDKKVIRNLSWIVVCKILQSILGLVINKYTATYLGTANYGLINYAATVVSFVLPIAQLGLSVVIIQTIVEHSTEHRDGEIMGSAILMSLISSLFCYAGCILFVIIVNKHETMILACTAAYGLSLFAQTLQLVIYWFQAKLMSKYISVISIIAYLITSLWKITLLITKAEIWLFALSYSIDFGIIAILGLIVFKKKTHETIRFSKSMMKELLDKSKYYIVPSLVVTILGQTDKLMLTLLRGNYENGIYTAAYTCATVSGFFFVALIDSFRPAVLQSYKNSALQFENNMKCLFSVLIYSSIIICVGYLFFSKWIILLFYNASYLQAVNVLRIVVWHSVFSYIGSGRDIWILAKNRQSVLLTINLSGALINIGLNFLFINIWGAEGAAWASLLSLVFVYFVLGLTIKKIRQCTILMIKGVQPKYMFMFLKSTFRRDKEKKYE